MSTLDAVGEIMSPKQLASIAWAPRRKIALWVGAVSAGKTVASLLAFLFAIREAPRGEIIVIIGKTLQSIEDNVISKLQDEKLWGELAAATIHTPGSNYAIILGRRVQLIGANNARAEARIRGATYGLAYVDEATLLPPNFWAMLLTRLRVKGARMLATTNPGSRNHWLKRLYIDRAIETNMIVFHLTMKDNPSLEPEYVRDMESTYADRTLYERFILGLWTSAVGAVYPDFDATVKPLDDPTAHVISWQQTPAIAEVFTVGMDWGSTNASTGLLLGLTAEQTVDERNRILPRPRLILLDEWRYDSKLTNRTLTPDQQAALFRDWYSGTRGFQFEHAPEVLPRASIRIGPIVDPSAPSFRTALRNIGFTSVQSADNDVMKGVLEVANLIASHHLLVTDRCPGFIGEATEYVYDAKISEEKGIDYPVTENDHSLDGARYAIRTTRGLWWPILKAAYRLAA